MGDWFYEWNNAWFAIQETASNVCHSLVDDLYLYDWLEPTIPISISLKNQKQKEEKQKKEQRKSAVRDTVYSLLASAYSGDYYTPMAYTIDTLYSFFPKEPNPIKISLKEETETETETIIHSKQCAKETYWNLKSFCYDAFYIELKWENNNIWLQSNHDANTKTAIDIFNEVYHRWYFFLKNSELEKGKRENGIWNSPKQKGMFKHLKQKLEGWIFWMEHFHFFVNNGFPNFLLNICLHRSVFSVFSLFSFLKREMGEFQQQLNDTVLYFPKEQRKWKKETALFSVRWERAKQRMNELEVRAREARAITDLLEQIQYNQTKYPLLRWMTPYIYSPLRHLANHCLKYLLFPFQWLGESILYITIYVCMGCGCVYGVCWFGYSLCCNMVRWVRTRLLDVFYSHKGRINQIGHRKKRNKYYLT